MTSPTPNKPAPDALPIRVDPDFLHGNSVMHTWVFSAVAELIDNASDADATELKIDLTFINNRKCLTFVDNGNGMDEEELFNMMSFGMPSPYHTDEGRIGRYGNGFKSGSMRLGESALVFTKREGSATIGFLSQTYLKEIKSTTILVPILQYSVPKFESRRTTEFHDNLKAILEYSPFRDEEKLKRELRGMRNNGTKIIISELKTLSDGSAELDSKSDIIDILCSHDTDTSKYRYSLKEYCSIFFMRPKMKIVLRGKKVQTKLMAHSLANKSDCSYLTGGEREQKKLKTTVTFGRTGDADPNNCGMMIYQRNRLILAFEKLKSQKDKFPQGEGIVGVTEANFLESTRIKQDFLRNKKFDSAMTAYNTKLLKYLESSPDKSARPIPDVWEQCDECLKWRKLPTGTDRSLLSDKWSCSDNLDSDHNTCEDEEECEKGGPNKKRVYAAKRKSDAAGPSQPAKRVNQQSDQKPTENFPEQKQPAVSSSYSGATTTAVAERAETAPSTFLGPVKKEPSSDPPGQQLERATEQKNRQLLQIEKQENKTLKKELKKKDKQLSLLNKKLKNSQNNLKAANKKLNDVRKKVMDIQKLLKCPDPDAAALNATIE